LPSYTEAFKVLIDAKMPDGSSRVYLHQLTPCGSAFKLAQYYGNAETMEILLDYGVSTSEVSPHSTPTM